jgi:hypothetical protein
MYSIGAFLGGKVMAVFPNEFEYYEELYKYAIDLSNETGVFLEIRYFDAVSYKEAMELSRLGMSFAPIINEDDDIIEEILQKIEERENEINNNKKHGGLEQ